MDRQNQSLALITDRMLTLLGAIVTLVACCLPTTGQNSAAESMLANLAGGGISVSGIGRVLARPEFLEIPIVVAASAELTDDAVAKYQSARQQLMDALEMLKLENLSSRVDGIELGMGNSAEMMNLVMQGQPPDASQKTSVTASSRIWLKIGGIQDMSFDQILDLASGVIDVVKDSGAQIGPSAADATMAYRYGRNVNTGLAVYVLEEMAEIREEAYQLAMADARQRAERLARLSELELGPVRTVVEIYVSDQPQRQPSNQPWQPLDQDTGQTRPRITTGRFDDIPFEVRLLVTYSVTPTESAE
jgi:uncharacterized protein YggE